MNHGLHQTKRVRQLLNQWHMGRLEALDELSQLLNEEFSRIAHRLLGGGRVSWQTGDLVNNHYLKLRRVARPQMFEDYGHFLAWSTTVMRNLLIDHARKRGRRGVAVTLEEIYQGNDDGGNLLLLELLDMLRSIDPKTAEIAELRMIMRYEVVEIALIMDCSATTVKREWRFAKKFFEQHLKRGGGLKPPPAG